jgi:hypothetical protein
MIAVEQCPKVRHKNFSMFLKHATPWKKLFIFFLEPIIGSDTEPNPEPDQTSLLPHNLLI